MFRICSNITETRRGWTEITETWLEYLQRDFPLLHAALSIMSIDSVADPWFSRRGANPLFGIISAENYMEKKDMDFASRGSANVKAVC